MNTRRALQKVSGAACLAVSLVVAHPSEAVEYGFGEYFLGLTIPMSGYLPPPGVYFQNTFLLYGGSRPALDANLVIDTATLGYYLDAEVFGGTFGLFATIPFVGDRN